jgi:hypothetical protein
LPALYGFFPTDYLENPFCPLCSASLEEICIKCGQQCMQMVLDVGQLHRLQVQNSSGAKHPFCGDCIPSQVEERNLVSLRKAPLPE